jgi:CBS domain-containing protein
MGLRQFLHDEPVSELPLRDVIRVLPSSTVRQAVGKMKEAGIGCVIVVDEYDRPLGKFTERVIIHKLAHTPGFMDEKVGDHMVSAEPGCVRVDQPIETVINYMRDTSQRFVCVSNPEHNQMVGLTGQKGIMEYIADHFPRAVKSQMMRSKLFMDDREGA